MKSYLGFWKAKLDKKWGKAVLDLDSWVEGSQTLHCGGPTLRRRSVRALELEAGREFCTWQVLTVPLKLQQNKEIPTPASWLSTEAGICVFPPVSAQLSSQVGDLLLLNLSWPGWAEDRAVGSQSSLLGILVSDMAFLAVSFLDNPLLLSERHLTHPPSSHVDVANSELSFLHMRLGSHRRLFPPLPPNPPFFLPLLREPGLCLGGKALGGPIRINLNQSQCEKNCFHGPNSSLHPNPWSLPCKFSVSPVCRWDIMPCPWIRLYDLLQFIYMTLKAQARKKIINWTSSKFKFCSSKDTIKRVKR